MIIAADTDSDITAIAMPAMRLDTSDLPYCPFARIACDCGRRAERRHQLRYADISACVNRRTEMLYIKKTAFDQRSDLHFKACFAESMADVVCHDGLLSDIFFIPVT